VVTGEITAESLQPDASVPTPESGNLYVDMRTCVHICVYVYMYICLSVYRCVYVYIYECVYSSCDLRVDGCTCNSYMRVVM